MATPVKSPLQKKHRGDAALDDDLQITSVSAGSLEQSLTLSAIEHLLDKKLDPLHQFLQQIRLDLNAFKESVRVEFEGMGLRVAATEKLVSDNVARVEALEKELGKMKVSMQVPCSPEPANPRLLSMVVGNMPNASSLEEAKGWLENHCRAFGITAPNSSDVYTKGQTSNLVFVKCQNESHRDRLIQSIRDVSKQQRESNMGEPLSNQLFAKIDLPLDVRTVEGALWAMKKMLVSWNFNAACIKYDIHTGILTVAGREIVKVFVQDFALKFEWCDGDWQKWEELQESSEMAEITNKAYNRLEKSRARISSKGKGKGPE